MVNINAESLDAFDPDMSLDGDWVAYLNFSDDLAGDTNGQCDVYYTEVGSGVTQIASVSSTGEQSNGSSCAFEGPVISADGSYIAFLSRGTNLVADDTNDEGDVFVHVNPNTGNNI